jgi:hypothetical protein
MQNTQGFLMEESGQMIVSCSLADEVYYPSNLTEESGQMIVSCSLVNEVLLPKQLDGGIWADDCEQELDKRCFVLTP